MGRILSTQGCDGCCQGLQYTLNFLLLPLQLFHEIHLSPVRCCLLLPRHNTTKKGIGFLEQVVWLYEQNAPQEEIVRRIGQYVRRWMRWVRSGASDVSRTVELNMLRLHDWVQ